VRELGAFSLEKRRLRGDLINTYQESSGWGQALSSSAQYITRGSGHKLEHRKFHLNMEKNFFTLRVTEHWKILPRDLVEFPSLEIFKNHLDTLLCILH